MDDFEDTAKPNDQPEPDPIAAQAPGNDPLPYPAARWVAVFGGIALCILTTAVVLWVSSGDGRQAISNAWPWPSQTPIPTIRAGCPDAAALTFDPAWQVEDWNLCVYATATATATATISPVPSATPLVWTDEQRGYRDAFYGAWDDMYDCRSLLQVTYNELWGHRSRARESLWLSTYSGAAQSCYDAFWTLTHTYPPPPYDGSNPLLDSHARMTTAMTYLLRVIMEMECYGWGPCTNTSGRVPGWLGQASYLMDDARDGVDLSRVRDPDYRETPAPVPLWVETPGPPTATPLSVAPQGRLAALPVATARAVCMDWGTMNYISWYSLFDCADLFAQGLE